MTQLLPLQVAETMTGLGEPLQRLYVQACDDMHVHAEPMGGTSFGQGLPHESMPPMPPLELLPLVELLPAPPAPPVPPVPPVPLAELVDALLVEEPVVVLELVVFPPPELTLVLPVSLLAVVEPLVSVDGVSVQLMTAALMSPSADKKNDKRTIVYASREIVILNLIGRKRSWVNAAL